MNFRVHHILCTQLYKGLGYSGSFCENMTNKVLFLRNNSDYKLTLVTCPDEICKKCPNLKDGDFCSNGDNHVHIKDLELLEPLHLEEYSTYSYSELLEHSRKYLTEKLFANSCHNCYWFQTGVCKYEDFETDNH